MTPTPREVRLFSSLVKRKQLQSQDLFLPETDESQLKSL